MRAAESLTIFSCQKNPGSLAVIYWFTDSWGLFPHWDVMGWKISLLTPNPPLTLSLLRNARLQLLGLHIDSSLSWSTHIDQVIKKTTTRLYFFKQLKGAGLSSSHILHFYITVIKPVLEYCAPVWLCALTKAETESLQAVHNRTIPIVHNLTRGMPYSSMLFYSNLNSLAFRRSFL